MTEDGVVTVPSRFGVAETMDSLVETVKRAGLLVFAPIDQAVGARGLRCAVGTEKHASGQGDDGRAGKVMATATGADA